jgi:hypothetical protein
MKAAPKKKPQTIAADTGLSKEHTSKFTGTSNARHLRAIAALLRRPMPRESLDKEAGCSNSPELVAELRRRGLDREKHLPCERVPFVDRDGKPCQPGVYHLTPAGKRLIRDWQLRIKEGRGAGHE